MPPILRRAGPDDTEGIARLLAATFPDNPKSDERLLRWQYWENPFGPAVSLVWTHGDEIVGHYAVVPVPIRLSGRIVKGSIGVDAATAPAFRGRGLYHQIIRASIESREGLGIEICLYYEDHEPRAESPYGRTRLELYALPLSSRWLARRMRVPSAVAALVRGLTRTPSAKDARTASDVPVGIDDLWRSVAGHEWGTVKDERWWRWRFASHPARPYRFFEVRSANQLRGAAVTRAGSSDGVRIDYVVELIAADADAARALVGAIVESSTDSAAVIARATTTSSVDRWLRAAGLRRVPRRFEPGASWFSWNPPFVEPREYRSVPWSVTLGDTDSI